MLHDPVMVKEVTAFFHDSAIKIFCDMTLGAGGHAQAILENHPELHLLIGCDRDAYALEIAKERLSPWETKVRLVRDNFINIDSILDSFGVQGRVDGFFLI